MTYNELFKPTRNPAKQGGFCPTRRRREKSKGNQHAQKDQNRPEQNSNRFNGLTVEHHLCQGQAAIARKPFYDQDAPFQGDIHHATVTSLATIEGNPALPNGHTSS